MLLCLVKGQEAVDLAGGGPFEAAPGLGGDQLRGFGGELGDPGVEGGAAACEAPRPHKS